MKKSALVLSAACLLTVFTHAQPVNTDIASIQNTSSVKTTVKNIHSKKTASNNTVMNARLKTAFSNDFGNIPVTSWESTVNFDKINFSKDGEAMTAFYDEHTQLIGTTAGKTFADLPFKAQQIINKRYSSYHVGEVLFFDDNELNTTDMILYDQPFEDADNYFVELQKGNSKIVVQVNMKGNVSFFTRLK